jgi:hypothetical protein
LIDLQFDSGMLRVTTAPVDIAAFGLTYTGLGSVISVSALSESEDANAEQLVISLSVVNQAMLAAVLGNVSNYRGRPVRLRLQLMDENYAPTGDSVLRWSGYMQPVRIARERGDSGPVGGRIELPCSRAGMSRARNYAGLRHTHAQQQQRYAGDRGLEYMQGLIEAPALWLSKRFQEL